MSLNTLSAALAVANPSLREEAIACIDNLPVRIVTDQKQLDDVEELLDRIERYRVDVLILEGGILPMPLDEFARRVKLTASQPAIFLLNSEAVAQKILEAIQAGAREYLCPPLGKPLKEAFERLAAVRGEQISTQQRKLGRIFGFLSAKGGAGATTFASHVASAVAQQTEKPVLLADLDFDAGILRFILKAKPTYSVRDALNNMHRMDTSYWNALVTRQSKYLDFIAAPEELTERVPPDPKQLARLLRFVRATYPVAILDFGRCYSAAALDSLVEMDALFLLVTQDLDALDPAKDFLRAADERVKGLNRVNVLLNKVPARSKPDPDGLQAYLGTKPVGIFTGETEALYEVWSEGRLLGGDTDLGRQFAALAKSMIERDETESDTSSAASVANPAASGLGRMFSFMRRSRG